MNHSVTIPLPQGWSKSVRAAILQVIALAQFSLACAEAGLARRKRRHRWLRGEHDRLRQEVELLRHEQRIKDARMERLKAQRRPHYLPTERMATLHVRFHAGHKQLPVVSLRRAA